jgi:Fic family protein
VHGSIAELISDMEKFVHNCNQFFPKFLKINLMHYQSETIHPFLDGNGRVGRLLITLYLVNRAFSKNVLYLSDVFERNLTLYYDNLMRVREKDNFLQWFKYLLTGVIETAKSRIDTFDKILQLQKKLDEKFLILDRRANIALYIIHNLCNHLLLMPHGFKNTGHSIIVHLQTSRRHQTSGDN